MRMYTRATVYWHSATIISDGIYFFLFLEQKIASSHKEVALFNIWKWSGYNVRAHRIRILQLLTNLK